MTALNAAMLPPKRSAVKKNAFFAAFTWSQIPMASRNLHPSCTEEVSKYEMFDISWGDLFIPALMIWFSLGLRVAEIVLEKYLNIGVPLLPKPEPE
ncbi:hypothetical protein M8J75_014700 [Diaphorina citri]|nr:hypothetical protein M8J75_014700 [Diaphorina citri]KAI5727362.1 hypothetical protein M8J77_001368 [Diaphorina citri]KAI5728229.1 hypothetical protein M8J77_013282 [Diaphorina citri]